MHTQHTCEAGSAEVYAYARHSPPGNPGLWLCWQNHLKQQCDIGQIGQHRPTLLRGSGKVCSVAD